MFFALGLIFLGAQIIFMGLTARGFSQLKRLSVREDSLNWFLKSFTVEKGIALGFFLAGAGLGVCAWVGFELLDFISNPANVGIFNMRLTKIGILGTTFAILGFQLIFSSFYAGLFTLQVAEDQA